MRRKILETEVSFLNDGKVARVFVLFFSYGTNDCAQFTLCLFDGNFSVLVFLISGISFRVSFSFVLVLVCAVAARIRVALLREFSSQLYRSASVY